VSASDVFAAGPGKIIWLPTMAGFEGPLRSGEREGKGKERREN